MIDDRDTPFPTDTSARFRRRMLLVVAAVCAASVGLRLWFPYRAIPPNYGDGGPASRPDDSRDDLALPTTRSYDYQIHLDRLMPRVPAGFHVVVEYPFIVIGNDPPDRLRNYARDVVAWAVVRLRRDFFYANPDQITDVWLFRDKASYEQYRTRLCQFPQDTPYGFYSEKDNALFMNIGTGRGTLVHLMLYPYLDSNFPACPVWFSAGLASLYEKPGDRGGHLYGYANWRLPDLQEGIRLGRVRPFSVLFSLYAGHFYTDRYADAQARYLCYYLQEKGLLLRFYRDFFSHQQLDPTGIQTLAAVLGETDLEAFQLRWNQFVLQLGVPELHWVDGQGYQP